MIYKEWNNNYFLRRRKRTIENNEDDDDELAITDAEILSEIKRAAKEIMKSKKSPASKLKDIQPLIALLAKTNDNGDNNANKNAWAALKGLINK